MQKLEDFSGKIAKNVLSPEVLQQLLQQCNASPVSKGAVDERRQEDTPRTDGPPANHWEIVMDLDSGPGAIPGFQINQTPSEQPGNHYNIISQGVLSLEDAQRYFDTYQNRLDHFPYHVLGDHGTATLECIREASPLLIAAICTVGALHLASKDFNLCYRELVSLSAARSFSKGNTIDDVRALCIGAFWLSDLSWTFITAAVRIATELQMHKNYFKALQGDRQHYLRARLYYLVYACDHHFSVAFGRPPLTRECKAIQNIRKFLECEHATEDDSRLTSQVSRWSLCSKVFDTFGVDIDRPLSDSEVPHLRRFSLALDNLRVEWADKFIPNPHVGNYPWKGVGLQYHFAKLYLCSHAFRGAGSDLAKHRDHDVAMELDEIANSAVLSALAILRTVVSDTEIQACLDGLPTYFDIMIAFAAVFLLKVSTKYSAFVSVLDVREIQRLMDAVVNTLKSVTSKMYLWHLLVSIKSLLQRSGWTEDPVAALPSAIPQQWPEQVLPDSVMLNGDFNWANGQAFDPYFMGEYDLLLSQDINFSLDFPLNSRPHQP